MIYKFGQKVLPNSIISISDDKVIIALEVKLPYNTSAFTGGSGFGMGKSNAQRTECTKKGGIISSHALRILLYKNMTQITSNKLYIV